MEEKGREGKGKRTVLHSNCICMYNTVSMDFVHESCHASHVGLTHVKCDVFFSVPIESSIEVLDFIPVLYCILSTVLPR